MGIQDTFRPRQFRPAFDSMAPMKSMKASAKPMTKGALANALATEHGLKQRTCSECFEDYRRHCHERGEEDGHFHNAWPVPYQNPNETSHQGRSQKCVWQGGEGQSKASKDDREGLPSCCIEAANLESF